MPEENIEQNVEETTSQETEELELDNTQGENPEGEQEASTDEDAETLKTKLAEAEKRAADLEEKNKQLFARVKKEKPKSEQKESSNSIDGNIELIEFIAKGNTKEDYSQIQAIMRGKDISFSEAMNDPLYTSYKDKKAREERDEKAQLGGSSSSSSIPKSDFKPGMTPEEHKEAWKKANGR